MHKEPKPVTIQLLKKLTAIVLMLAATLTLLGCANNSSQPNYDLDTYTLGRSAVFTQRELINEQLKDPAEINSQVRDTLIYNYCDLVARNAIYIARDNLPKQCQSLSAKEPFSDNKQRQCAYNYHICVKACPLRTNDCQPCIKRAKKCLAP
ncbi:hypothetical protein NYF23_11140 [SAR92 clade bacterium H455]|uniref:Uncharacterized protein n=1 Tax=SAR92 clade bacterium H455 TaxID=2974818 RepID=A0ABY5TQI5_9GAMM|nr:hypothetical protein NYF23_11140 [SAR92 clade bacterium H455]